MPDGYGKVADPAGAAPRRVKLATRATAVAGSESVMIRYGPYKVPNMGQKNIMGEGGALWNYPDRNIEKPCEECIIVGMNAGLEYPDGRNANIDSNQWLHHVGLILLLLCFTRLTDPSVCPVCDWSRTCRRHLRQ